MVSNRHIINLNIIWLCTYNSSNLSNDMGIIKKELSQIQEYDTKCVKIKGKELDL